MRASIQSWLAAFVILPALTGGIPPLSAAAEGGISPSALFPDAAFDSSIPTQRETLGFEHGERPVRHAELMRYLRTLADASPRAALFSYAKSHEGRELVYFAVSDEATMGRLDAFRAAHARRLDPRGRAASEDDALLKDAKAVAWIAYGIHGDELSSVDAAAAIAYRLTAGEDALSRRLREGLVILIDPIENPDGRERYLAQITSFAHASPSADMEDLSHAGAWPWGRGNHYFFDLNRDWFSLVHPESRRSTEIAGWNPQLMVDSHEMGGDDTYLFSPPRHPFNPHLPASHHTWMYRFGDDQARALDARGYPYYTGEWNEEFFPGYGSSWASYRGAIGILYEMSGTEGTRVRRRDGVVRTFAQAIEHQATSSIANLTTLADNRAAILHDFVADRRAAIAKARRGPIGAWVVPEGRYPKRVRRLVWILRSQGIEVLHADSPRLSGLRDAWTGEKAHAPKGPTWIVPLDQPAGPLVRAILDPHVPMDAEFLREEREYLERGKGSRLYETTAWSLLLAYGLEAYWAPPLRRDPDWKETLIPGFAGEFEERPDAVAWIVDGVPDAAPALLADLLQRGVVVKVADRPFTTGGRAWDRGALVIPREGNPEGLTDILRDASARWRTPIRAVSTAKTESGPDLGGGHFHLLVGPRVGVWTGSPVSPSAYGAIWRLLDEDVRLRFSGLDISRFRQVDLERYNVLIFPPVFGGAGVYRQMLGGQGLERLKAWIEGGGTAIGIGGGAAFLADEETGITQARLRRQALDRYPPVVLGPGAREALEGGPFRAAGLRAPAVEGADGGGKRGKKGDGGAGLPEFRGTSPYDVAPILGPGARPFAEGVDLGTPVDMRPVDLAEWLRPMLPPGKGEPEPEEFEAADERLRRFRPHGAYLRIELDPDAWLGWGLPAEMPALVRARDALVAGPPVQVAARFATVERLHLGGLLWPEAAARLAHTAYVTREGKGRGQVILFLDPPEIRGWTLATRRLLLNAILLGPGAGTRWSTPW